MLSPDQDNSRLPLNDPPIGTELSVNLPWRHTRGRTSRRRERQCKQLSCYDSRIVLIVRPDAGAKSLDRFAKRNAAVTCRSSKCCRKRRWYFSWRFLETRLIPRKSRPVEGQTRCRPSICGLDSLVRRNDYPGWRSRRSMGGHRHETQLLFRPEESHQCAFMEFIRPKALSTLTRRWSS